jgi:tetratricopeptide (TPR) repeat protein
VTWVAILSPVASRALLSDRRADSPAQRLHRFLLQCAGIRVDDTIRFSGEDPLTLIARVREYKETDRLPELTGMLPLMLTVPPELPGAPDAINCVASTAMNHGAPIADVIMAFRRALASATGLLQVKVLLNLGWALVTEGQFHEAAACAKEGLVLLSTMPDHREKFEWYSLFLLGTGLSLQGRPEQALPYFLLASTYANVTTEIQRAMTRYSLAHEALCTGRVDMARAWLKERPSAGVRDLYRLVWARLLLLEGRPRPALHIAHQVIVRYESPVDRRQYLYLLAYAARVLADAGAKLGFSDDELIEFSHKKFGG